MSSLARSVRWLTLVARAGGEPLTDGDAALVLMAGTPEHNLDARARTMDQPLASQVQAVGRDINTVLARFHAVSRHAPSVVAQDGTLEAVPCSVIERGRLSSARTFRSEPTAASAARACQGPHTFKSMVPPP